MANNNSVNNNLTTLNLPNATSATVGPITYSGSRFMHNYPGGNTNIFLGINAGNFTSSGAEENIGIGGNSLSSLTSGTSNISIGFNSGTNLNSATYHVIVGQSSLQSITSGDSNVSVGSFNMVSLGTGNSNIALGGSNGSSYTGSESDNIFIGNGITGTIGDSAVTYIGNIYSTAPSGTTKSVFINSDNQLSAQASGSGSASFSAFNTTTQSISASTTSTIVFDSTQFNTGSNYSTGTNLFTAPVTALYQFYVEVNVATHATSTGDVIRILVNSTPVASSLIRVLTGNQTTVTAIALSLTAGNTVSATYQNTAAGGAATINGGTGPTNFTYFYGYQLN